MTLRQRKQRRKDLLGLAIIICSVAILALGMALQYAYLTIGSC